MSVCSLEFLLCLLALSAVFYRLPGLRGRQFVLAACNGIFLYPLVPNSASWLTLALFLLSGWGIVQLMRARPSRVVFVAYLILLLSGFIFLKKYDFLRLVFDDATLAHPVSVVGLSYMLFRQIHVVVDVFQGQIKRVPLWSWLNYQLNLFAILSGPIQRFQEFDEAWGRLEPVYVDYHALLKTYLRIFFGVVQVAALGAICLKGHEWAIAPFSNGAGATTSKSRAGIALLAMIYIYPAYVYFNFVGYCNIVIGGMSLLGMKLPENFDRPYLARNLIDFWTRWHRTLGLWIRDYVFTPLYKSIAQRWPQRAASMAFLCYFVAFFLAGIWHGSTWNFAAFGLLHAGGVSAAKLWESFLIRRGGRSGLREYMKSAKIRVAAVVTTFHYACATFLFFPVGLDRTFAILRAVFARLI